MGTSDASSNRSFPNPVQPGDITLAQVDSLQAQSDDVAHMLTSILAEETFDYLPIELSNDFLAAKIKNDSLVRMISQLRKTLEEEP
ncbi:hypothetical protein [Natronoglycomyces albus]|uniref:Uncharacterized protein n=1 Tax=Natronoglycomyces albus TaxID=2811108 RepID=A0A895XMX0_9ACTN|nr:hypothetical protein [Natronoglycomyces albus]QSB05122.1 hypothetical protein JQS30_15395 [Natronoglycomyces albus]